MSLDWTNPNLRWVLGGAMLLGVASAVLGCFALLRGRSLMGDVLAHAALPGVCLAFLFAEWGRRRGLWALDGRSLPLLLAGAGLTGLLAAWSVSAVTRHSRIKEDAAQAIVLSVFFGGGVVLLTRIQHVAEGNAGGLDRFLFGQVATLVASDVRALTGVAAILCLLVALFYKEFKLLCFDPDFARGQGWPVSRLDALLLGMVVVSVVSGLQAVGVVLISALLIVPPAAARFWTDRLGVMVVISALVGGASGALGALLSAVTPDRGGAPWPTGPLIVLCAAGLFAVSLLFAPNRGLLPRAVKSALAKREVRRTVEARS